MCAGRRHEETKNVVNRLSRAIGHLESVKRMVEEEKDCAEVLIQLSAVRAAINRAGQILLKDHIGHCVADALETGDRETLEKLNQAIDQFLK